MPKTMKKWKSKRSARKISKRKSRRTRRKNKKGGSGRKRDRPESEESEDAEESGAESMEPQPFTLEYDNRLVIEPYAPMLPTEFPHSDTIKTINFEIGSYYSPLENTNILSQIDFSLLQNLTKLIFDTRDAITGTLPVELFSLPLIHTIVIKNNEELTGNIPNLPVSLRSLNLSNNSLDGPIPELPHFLISLSLGKNLLDGEIPALPANLQIIELNDNSLTGSLPQVLPNNLRSFDVCNNQLSEVIPVCVRSRLQKFKISGNNFFDDNQTVSIGNLLIMVRDGRINMRSDSAFYEVFDDMPQQIRVANDETKLNYLLEQFEASAPTLMG